MNQARPFRLLGVQQIAVGGADKAPLRVLWEECLGLTKSGEYRSLSENVDEDILRLRGPLGEVEVDLMVPIDSERAPRVHQPALNHIGFWVDDLRAAATWLSARGVRLTPGGIRLGAAGHEVCFIHPKANAEFPLSGEGVLIELVQAPPELLRLAAGG